MARYHIALRFQHEQFKFRHHVRKTISLTHKRYLCDCNHPVFLEIQMTSRGASNNTCGIRGGLNKKMSHNGTLEIVEQGNEPDSSQSSSRPTSSSSRRAPPVGGLAKQNSLTSSGRNTPVIEKSLVSVRRKEPAVADNQKFDVMNFSDDDDGDDILAMANLSLDTNLTSSRKRDADKTSQSAAASSPLRVDGLSSKPAPASTAAASVNGHIKGASNSKEDSESGSEEESSDEEERKAPNQLIMEFLQCVMDNDTENGLKLCKMILLYEPTNSQALKFLPLLEEKKVQDEAGNEADDDTGSDESSDDDSDDDSDDSEEETDDSSDDDDDLHHNGSGDGKSLQGKDWAPIAR